MKKNIRLIAAIFNEKSEILLMKEKKAYKLPFGTINKNERLEKAYKRFIFKDTGLTVELLNIVYALNFDEIERISIIFACVPLKKYKPTKELPESYSWTEENETKKLTIDFPDREILTRAYCSIK